MVNSRIQIGRSNLSNQTQQSGCASQLLRCPSVLMSWALNARRASLSAILHIAAKLSPTKAHSSKSNSSNNDLPIVTSSLKQQMGLIESVEEKNALAKAGPIELVRSVQTSIRSLRAKPCYELGMVPTFHAVFL